MTRLEEQVGAKLIFRSRTGIQLTPLGDRLLPLAEEIERVMFRATRDLDKQDALSGRLRVAMSDGMAGYWLAPHLRQFHRTHPHVTLDMQVTDSTSSVDLSRREADITIVYAYPSDPDVVVLKSAALVLAPLCSKKFAADWGVPTNLSDVLRYPVCTHTMHHRKEGTMRPWAEMLEQHSMITYRTGSSLVLAEVVRMGIGLSLQPIGVFEREEDILPLDLGFRCELPFFLVCHREVKDVPIVRAMLQHLTESLFTDDASGPAMVD